MKFATRATSPKCEILHNDHYVGIPYDCSAIAANDKGVIPSGTIIPANDETAVGVLMYDVVKDENPNGTILIHAFITKSKLPEAPASTVKLPLIQFMD